MIISSSFQDEVISFAQELVRIDSPSGQEGAVAQKVAEKCRSLSYDDVQIDAWGNVLAKALTAPVVLRGYFFRKRLHHF